MPKEIKEVRATALDTTSDNFWENVLGKFDENPELIQQIKIDCGHGKIASVVISMHEDKDGNGYYQFEDIYPDTLAIPYLDYCIESGEVLPDGIYRIYYSS